ncbi:hypothetical protein D3C71_969810 [compost metagenome]
MGVEIDVVRDVEAAHDPIQTTTRVVAQAHFERGLAQGFVGVEARGRIGRAVAIALDRAGRALEVADHGQVQVVAQPVLQDARHAVDVDALGRVFRRIELVGVVVLAGVGDIAVQSGRDPVVLARIAAIPATEQLQRQVRLGAEVHGHGGATREQISVAEAFAAPRIDNGRDLGLDDAADHGTVAAEIARAGARHEAPALLGQDGQAHADLVPQRTADGRLHGGVVMAADLDAARTFNRVAGPFGDGVDHAGRGVAAVQGALRPFEDLDAIQVKQRHAQIGVGGLIDAVHVQGDRRVAVGLVVVRAANAADADQAVVGAAEGVVDRDAGNLVHQARDAVDAATRGVVAVQQGDGQRHVLDPLRALLSGDDHLVDGGDVGGAGANLRNRKGALADLGRDQARSGQNLAQRLGRRHEADDATGALAAHQFRREDHLDISRAGEAGQGRFQRLAFNGEGDRLAAQGLREDRRSGGQDGHGAAGQQAAFQSARKRRGSGHW